VNMISIEPIFDCLFIAVFLSVVGLKFGFPS